MGEAGVEATSSDVRESDETDADVEISTEDPVASLGRFPFAKVDGVESRQTEWVREHANYMNRGLVGYLSALGLFTRGIIVNFLVTLPVLILLALCVAAVSISGWGFRTAVALAIAMLAWIVVSPILLRLRQVALVRRVVQLGHESSFDTRRRSERVLGALLLLFGLATTAEAASYFLDDFHFWTRERGIGLGDLASISVFLVPTVAFLSRVLPHLKGAKEKAALAVAAGLGVLLPTIIVLVLADYLAFDVPGRVGTRLVLIAGAVLWTLMVVTMLIGLVVSAAFSKKFVLQAAAGLIAALALLAGGAVLADRLFSSQSQLDEKLAEFSFAPPAGDPSDDSTDRDREIERLAGNAAARPPGELQGLIAFLREARRSNTASPDIEVTVVQPDADEPLDAPEVAIGPEPQAEVSEARQRIFDELDRIESLDGGFRDADTFTSSFRDQLATTAADDDTARADDLEALRRHLELAAPLLRNSEDSIAPLIVHAMRDFNDAAVTQTPPTERYDSLGIGGAQEALDALRSTLLVFDDNVHNLRVELARVAISSAQYPTLRSNASDVRWLTFRSSALFAVMLALLLWCYGWLAVDPNRTTLHALYRDRLASTFLVGRNPDQADEVRIEPDLNLSDLCRYDLNSVAPYYLINGAVNLQSSRERRTRGRKSDFFIFSKRFIGSTQTGYCRSSTMERVMPEMNVQMAMAVSAAAAAPNMGRSTSKALRPFMVFLNARLGQWIPNPGRLDARHGSGTGYTVDQIITEEKRDINLRWINLQCTSDRRKNPGLLGLAFSGGGIRSASLNLGIVQALHAHGVYRHVDYLSTVSGGGYLGSAISVGMRSASPVRCPSSGRVSITTEDDQQLVTFEENGSTYRYNVGKSLAIAHGDEVTAGERIIKPNYWSHYDNHFNASKGGEFGAQFYWRARHSTLFREMTGQLHEHGRSVNISDGGHIENLGVFELLRRKCQYIIVGDAEMDPDHAFGGLSVLIRTARVELGAEIEIDLRDLQPDEQKKCARHFAVGRIHYRRDDTADSEDGEEPEPGFLLYFKSSIVGDEPVDVQGYLAENEGFPHESTADQFFDEGQFESYRRLGECMASQALAYLGKNPTSFADIGAWLSELHVATQPLDPDALLDLAESDHAATGAS